MVSDSALLRFMIIHGKSFTLVVAPSQSNSHTTAARGFDIDHALVVADSDRAKIDFLFHIVWNLVGSPPTPGPSTGRESVYPNGPHQIQQRCVWQLGRLARAWVVSHLVSVRFSQRIDALLVREKVLRLKLETWLNLIYDLHYRLIYLWILSWLMYACYRKQCFDLCARFQFGLGSSFKLSRIQGRKSSVNFLGMRPINVD